MAHLIRNAAQEIPHPTKSGRTLWDALEDDGPYDGDIDPGVWSLYSDAISGGNDSLTEVVPLGSGSDYTVFLQHLGVSILPFYFILSLNISCRWRAWIKVLDTLYGMQSIIITQFMILNVGRGSMVIQALTDRYDLHIGRGQ